MDAITDFIAQLPAYLLDHPELIVVAAVVAVAVGVITWRSSKPKD